MTRTTTIEFEFEYRIIIGQLDPRSEITPRIYFSVGKFYREFADKQSDLLEYKDAENIAIDFRNDLQLIFYMEFNQMIHIKKILM